MGLFLLVVSLGMKRTNTTTTASIVDSEKEAKPVLGNVIRINTEKYSNVTNVSEHLRKPKLYEKHIKRIEEKLPSGNVISTRKEDSIRPCKLNSLFIVTRFLNLHEGGRSIFNIQYNYDQKITH